MSDYYVGEIRIFAGQKPPQNWLLCDGTALPISGYEVLFALLGTIWGGDGRTNFKIPDLRGRLVVGQGSGTNLTPRVLGQTGGVEAVALTQAEIPAHTHAFNTSTATAMTATPGATVMPAALSASYVGYLPANQQSATVSFDSSMIQSTGSNGAHGNVMPYVALNYMICFQGTYPVQS